MHRSHLDVPYLGQVEPPQSAAAMAAGESLPAVSPDGDAAPAIPAITRRIMGLTPQQWIVLLLVAGLTAYLVARRRRRRRS